MSLLLFVVILITTPSVSVGVTLGIVVVGIISILILVSQELAQQGLDVNQSLLLNLHSLFLGI